MIISSKSRAQAEEIERLQTRITYLQSQVDEWRRLLAQSQRGSAPPDVVRFLREYALPALATKRVDIEGYGKFCKWLEAQP